MPVTPWGFLLIFETAIAFVALVVGIVVMVYSSDKAVEHSVKIASALRISPLMIGLVLVSIGTDLPEIVNSIISCAVGHADINVGDSLGSVLTQMTLVIGLLPFLAGKFKVKRKEILVIGACEILALILAVSIAEKGYFTRVNALLLVASWPVFMLLIRSATTRNPKEKKHVEAHADEKRLRDFVIAILGFIGVAVGAYVVIQSVIKLSAVFHVSEYIISFFVVAIGTSLPELAVEFMALRKKQYELAVGDAIGSCIVDASVSVGIGLLFFPQAVSGQTAMITGLYAIFGSIVVVLTLALREKVDKKAGALFILVYLLSYTLLAVI
ncbi:sodium:calcium antiporter [Candidatus Bathyarchaeota archaeon]|nr:MAG: sodium:calcium antiporter [Candidatus Bathyarchaeota archaeon]